MAFLAFLALLNPPKADANPIAIPPSTPASSSDENSHKANGSALEKHCRAGCGGVS